MKKMMKNLIALMLLIAVIFALTACGENEETKSSKNSESSETSEKALNTISEEEMKDLSDEEKIEHAVYGLLKSSYGEDLGSAKIYVDKMYKKEEADKNDTLKELKVGEKDIAFEVSIHIEPAEGADIFQFTVPDGVYDEETGWVSEISRLGILRYDSNNKTYFIDHYGTGW